MILQNGRASFGGIKCKDFLMDHAQASHNRSTFQLDL